MKPCEAVKPVLGALLHYACAQCVQYPRSHARQDKHREHFGIHRIRAVLIEAPDADQAGYLRRLTEHPVVLGGRRNPSPLSWFTTSEFFTKLLDIDEAQQPEGTRKLPRWLAEPATIAQPIWFTPVDDEPQSLLHH